MSASATTLQVAVDAKHKLIVEQQVTNAGHRHGAAGTPTARGGEGRCWASRGSLSVADMGYFKRRGHRGLRKGRMVWTPYRRRGRSGVAPSAKGRPVPQGSRSPTMPRRTRISLPGSGRHASDISLFVRGVARADTKVQLRPTPPACSRTARSRAQVYEQSLASAPSPGGITRRCWTAWRRAWLAKRP